MPCRSPSLVRIPPWTTWFMVSETATPWPDGNTSGCDSTYRIFGVAGDGQNIAIYKCHNRTEISDRAIMGIVG